MTHIQNSVLRLFKKTDISVKENNIVSFDVWKQIMGVHGEKKWPVWRFH